MFVTIAALTFTLSLLPACPQLPRYVYHNCQPYLTRSRYCSLLSLLLDPLASAVTLTIAHHTRLLLITLCLFPFPTTINSSKPEVSQGELEQAVPLVCLIQLSLVSLRERLTKRKWIKLIPVNTNIERYAICIIKPHYIHTFRNAKLTSFNVLHDQQLCHGR